MKDPIVRGHPIHAIMTDVPIGATVAVVVFDLIAAITHANMWLFVAQATVAVAAIGGIGAALVGLWDYQAVPKDHPARSIGAQHGVLNTVALVLLLASFFLRYGHGAAVPVAQIVSLVAFGLFGLTGWLGGQMVYHLGWRVTPAEYDEQLEADLRKRGETDRITQVHQSVSQYEREHDLLPRA